LTTLDFEGDIIGVAAQPFLFGVATTERGVGVGRVAELSTAAPRFDRR
jgi:hypothetical protein